MWGHVDVPQSAGSVTEIARGATLGGVGWTSGASHDLVLEYTSTRLVVWVDDVLQVDLAGDFPAGPFGVYDFSQPGASFSDVTFEELNSPPTVLNGGASDASAPEGPRQRLPVLSQMQTGTSSPCRVLACATEVTITASDRRTTTSDSFMVTGTNVAPVIGSSATSDSRVNVDIAFSLSGAFTDAGILDSHVGIANWDDGSGSPSGVVSANGTGSFSASHEFSQPGSYQVTATITDDDGGSDSVTHTVEVFNADDFVTGGGWVTSPAGAVLGAAEHTGKATFGFVAKYRKDGTVHGNLTLQVHKAFMFKATSFSSLDIADGTAVFAGVGELDGGGSVPFTVVAVDERVSSSPNDTFWITIEGVYDGGVYPAGGLAITGKGIQIHDR